MATSPIPTDGQPDEQPRERSLYELGLRFGGQKQEDDFWRQTLTALASKACISVHLLRLPAAACMAYAAIMLPRRFCDKSGSYRGNTGILLRNVSITHVW